MKKAEIQKRLQDVLRTSPARGQVRRVSLFGSHLHGTAKKDSDIDLLIEFREPVSMFTLVRMEREMSRAFGRPIDLCTLKGLSKYFRSAVEKEAEPLYESIS
ncbi:MAG: nucleotidyltransferase [Candidatus Peribacteraceae bacterium]|nr:nucleotidyltransferase [Candidatus Peribacteraceae bacterium]